MDDIINIGPLIRKYSIVVEEPTTRIDLWYRNEGSVDTDIIIDDNASKIINRIFETVDIKEYIPVANVILDHVLKHKLIQTQIANVHAYVSDNSKYSFDHKPKHNKRFIKLFTMIFESESVLKKIIVNAEMCVPAVKLAHGTVKHTENDACDNDEDNDEDNNEDNDKDNENCSICLNNTGALVTTYCNHKFHLGCLQRVPKMQCPLCRSDIIPFLKSNGITEEIINTCLTNQETEQELEDHLELIAGCNFENMNNLDFLRISIETLRLNGGDISQYAEIIFCMSANASKLFAEISHIESKKSKGLFIYIYRSPTDFILHMRNPNNPSIVQWFPVDELKDTVFDNIMDNINEITDTQNEYVVGVLIDDIAHAFSIEKDACDEPCGKRLSQKNINHSISSCIQCVCPFDTTNSINREYIWAEKKLNSLKHKV